MYYYLLVYSRVHPDPIRGK